RAQLLGGVMSLSRGLEVEGGQGQDSERHQRGADGQGADASVASPRSAAGAACGRTPRAGRERTRGSRAAPVVFAPARKGREILRACQIAPTLGDLVTRTGALAREGAPRTSRGCYSH